MPNARIEFDPFAGTPLGETGGEAPGSEARPASGAGFEDEARAEIPGDEREETGPLDPEETGAGSENEGSERFRMGLGRLDGDAQPVERPMVPAGAGTPSGAGNDANLQPRKRGRPAGSKNKPKTQGGGSGPQSNLSWYGGSPAPKAEADAAAKVIVEILKMPCALAAKLKRNPDFALDDTECEGMRSAFSEYMQIRGDILGYWGPEIMLGAAVIPPFYARWAMWQDPSGEAAKVVKQAMANAQNAGKEAA